MGKYKQLKTKESYADTFVLWASFVFLTIYGLIMVYSASSSYNTGQPAALFKRQLLFGMFGIIACLVGQFLDYKMLYDLAPMIYVAGIGLNFALLSPLGVSVNGATRWLYLFGFQFQVAEVVKIAVIVMMAYMIRKHADSLNNKKIFTKIWLIGGIAAALLFEISNDLSSSVVVLGITFGLTFIYTKKEKIHFGVAGLAVGAVGLYVWSIWRNLPGEQELENLSFRVGRIAAWIAPEKYAASQGYQTLQALYAIGHGGIWGCGLGNSVQKLKAIPEAQNDMIFSVICEELGLVGAILLLCLFAYLCLQLYLIAISAKDLFGSALAAGVLLHIALQTLFNVGVNTKLLPNTGIGLPFISYGGTALFCQLAEMAIVLSVGRVANGKKVKHFWKKEKKSKTKSRQRK